MHIILRALSWGAHPRDVTRSTDLAGDWKMCARANVYFAYNLKTRSGEGRVAAAYGQTRTRGRGTWNPRGWKLFDGNVCTARLPLVFADFVSF